MSGPSIETRQSPTPDNLIYGTLPTVTDSANVGASTVIKRGTILQRLAAAYSLAVTAATSGNFTLSAIGKTTAVIAHDATAAAVKTALDAVFGVGNVTTSGGALGTAPVVITFAGTLAGAEVELTVDGAGLVGEGAAVVATETATSQVVSPVTSVPAVGTPLFVAAEAVTTGAGESARITVYSAGDFNSRALDIDSVLLAGIREHLRTKGIFIHTSATNGW